MSRENGDGGLYGLRSVASCKTTAKEFARFLDMSIKSANETEGHLLKARDLDLFSAEEWQRFTAEAIEIRKMTYSYRRTMLANDAKANQKKPNS